MPWPLFWGLLRECSRFDAREWLRALDGPMLAAARMMGAGGHGDALLIRQDLVKEAGYE